MRIKVFDRDQYVIALRGPATRRKIFQILRGRDGSLYVAFPYYQHDGGQLGTLEMGPERFYPRDTIWGEHSKATTHQVKYSHHPSGVAHFSLTGKVRTEIRRHAVPLSRAKGHLFTLMVQGIEYFEELKKKEMGTSKRGIVPFPMDVDPGQGLKFLGLYYALPDWKAKLATAREGSGPWMRYQDSDDEQPQWGLPLHSGYVHQGVPRILEITAEKIPPISMGGHPVMLTFMGGFDPPEIAFDHSQKTACLLFIYPSSSPISEAVISLGTVDLDGAPKASE